MNASAATLTNAKGGLSMLAGAAGHMLKKKNSADQGWVKRYNNTLLPLHTGQLSFSFYAYEIDVSIYFYMPVNTQMSVI